MSKASTRMLEQGIQAPSPAPDLIPAETSTENLHRDWNYERGHITDKSTEDATDERACIETWRLAFSQDASRLQKGRFD